VRLAVRHTRIAPLVAELEGWMRAERARLSRHAEVAKAMDYLLKRWPPSPSSSTTAHLPEQQRRRARCAALQCGIHCTLFLKCLETSEAGFRIELTYLWTSPSCPCRWLLSRCALHDLRLLQE
jgi:hypothetical protein